MRKITLALVLVLAIGAVAGTPSSAYGYNLLGYKLKYGVGDYGNSTQRFYITSSATKYSSIIGNAMSEWVHTSSRLGVTTPISYTRTSTQTSSRMDIYSGNYYAASTGIIAETLFYSGSTLVNPRSKNWVWGKIKLNYPVFNGLGTSNRKGSVAHEMGHVMGLNENNSNSKSIMCQLGAGRSVYSAQKDDCNGINYLY